MSYSENPYQAFGLPADRVAVDARVEFIRKTYIHLTGAVLAFALICGGLLQLQAVQDICASFIQNRFMYLVAMLGLIGVSFVCTKWVSQPTSLATQYAGLALYTVAEAIFFLPMLWVAQKFYPGSITSAGAITVAVFSGLTLSVFITKADFSFLRSALFIGGFALIGIAIIAMFIPSVAGNSMLSLVLGGAFVVLAAGYILYHTSMVLHHYPVNMHVAAALALFASLATLFWYILQLVMSRRN